MEMGNNGITGTAGTDDSGKYWPSLSQEIRVLKRHNLSISELNEDSRISEGKVFIIKHPVGLELSEDYYELNAPVLGATQL